MNGPTSRRAAGRLAVVAVFLFAAARMAPTYAVHDDGVFQIDGDAAVSTCGGAFGTIGCTGDDWNSLYACTAGGGLGCTKATPGVGNGASAISDLVTDPSPLSIFTGGGSKDESDITQWRWKDGSVPDKDDLVEAFAALYQPASGALGGKKVIYFGANRLAVNGDAQIGFWFFQKAVAKKSDGTFQDSDGNPATHEVGDILILSNFVQGGGSSNIQVYVVNTVNLGPSQVTCPVGSVETSAQAGQICLTQLVNGTAGANGVCNPAGHFPADVACAATNGSAVPALDPDFVAKTGPAATYPPVGFFEGGLDLTDVNLGGECFPAFAVETRSSQSISAVLKDFTLGAFENCEAAVRTEIHAAADNGDPELMGSVGPLASFHDLAIVTGTQGAPIPTGKVTFRLFFNATTAPACTGTPSNMEDVSLAPGGPGCPTGATCANTSALSKASASPGYYSYDATYLGDGNYKAVGPSNCEPLTVNKLDSAIATHIFTVDGQGNLLLEKTDNFIDLAGAASQAVRDQAVVTRKSPASGDPTPTGTVTFSQFPFSNCTGTPSTEIVNLGSCPGTAPPGGTATACSTVLSLGPNTLGYKATYGGDSNYNGSSLSRCEPVCAIDTTK